MKTAAQPIATELSDKTHVKAADTSPLRTNLPTTAAEQAGIIEAARKQGARAERTRQQEIIMSPAGLKRPTLAHVIAFTTDFDSNAAIDILKSAPTECVLRSSRLDGNVPTPRVGLDTPDAPQGGGTVDWDLIVEKINAETKKSRGE